MFERFALIRREPLTEVTTFDTEVDRFLNNALDFFELPVYASGPLFAEREIVAPMEVFDRDGHTVVRLEVPGIKIEDIDISVSDGMLTIKGEKSWRKRSSRETAIAPRGPTVASAERFRYPKA